MAVLLSADSAEDASMHRCSARRGKEGAFKSSNGLIRAPKAEITSVLKVGLVSYGLPWVRGTLMDSHGLSVGGGSLALFSLHPYPKKSRELRETLNIIGVV